MILATPTPSLPPGTSALVIGAALVLLGSAMAMVTRWAIYSVKGRKAWMEKWGLRTSFGGAVAAVWGAGEAIISSGEHPVIGGVLLVIALAMSGLLLAPIVLRGPASVQEEEAEEQPRHEHKEGNVRVCGPKKDSDQVIRVEGGTEVNVEHRKPSEAQSEPG
jgi:hypothetical protein